MLRSMSASQLRAWQDYDRVEPFGEWRMDFRLAHIVQTLVGDPKRNLTEFVLPFGDTTQTVKKVEPQSLVHQERILEGWFHVNNLLFEHKGTNR